MGQVTAFEPPVVRQVQAFPAPVCGDCQVAKWLRRRVSCETLPHTQTRLSFVCLECGDLTNLRNQTPIPLR